MHTIRMISLISLAGLSACTPFILAPGAADVKVTNVAADVTGCTPVGNLRAPEDEEGHIDRIHVVRQLQNQTVGLGGNVTFVTEGTLKRPYAGIAYKCTVARS